MITAGVRQDVNGPQLVAAPKRCFKTARDLGNKCVAGVVTGPVAETRGDVGEVVDVDCQHRGPTAQRRHSRQRIADVHREEVAVGQTGERVVVALKGELVLSEPAVGDVVPDDDRAEQLAGPVEQRLAIDGHLPALS